MIEGRTLAILGAVISALAVALGAFGAHALRDTIDPGRLETWTTATHYMGWHALALLLTGVFAETVAPGLMQTAGLLFLAGLVLFCGSLIVLALGGPRWVGAVAPIGGLALIGGWLTAAAALYRAYSGG